MSLFVGNISKNVRERDLEDEFGKFGRCTIKPKGSFAFIEFDDEAAADAAVKNLQGLNMGGLKIGIEWSRSSGRYDASQSKRPPPRESDQKCYNCNKIGHFARECRSRRRSRSRSFERRGNRYDSRERSPRRDDYRGYRRSPDRYNGRRDDMERRDNWGGRGRDRRSRSRDRYERRSPRDDRRREMRRSPYEDRSRDGEMKKRSQSPAAGGFRERRDSRDSRGSPRRRDDHDQVKEDYREEKHDADLSRHNSNNPEAKAHDDGDKDPAKQGPTGDEREIPSDQQRAEQPADEQF